jgi:hypothetical protein
MWLFGGRERQPRGEEHGVIVSEGRFWSSQDGWTWSRHEIPSAVPPRSEHAAIAGAGMMLIAGGSPEYDDRQDGRSAVWLFVPPVKDADAREFSPRRR